MNFGLLLLGIACLVSLGIFIYTMVLRNKDEDFVEEKAIVYNSMTQYTKHKRFEGRLKRLIEHDGWTAVEFYPRDVNHKKLEKEGKVLEPEVVFVPNENLEWIAKGGVSGDCTLLAIHPINKEDLPEGLKRSIFGQGFLLGSLKADRERTEDDLTRVRDNSEKWIQEKLLNKKSTFLDLVEEHKGMKEQVKSLVKEIPDEK